MTKTLRPILALLLLPVVVVLAMPAEASVNAFWKELGGSATGGGVSQLSPPRGTGNGVDTTTGADGRPIVIYTDSTIGEDGRVLAKRWTGTAWQMISPAAGINDPAIGGENPQLVISPAGTFFAAWTTREPGGGQVHLRRRVGTSTVWEQLDNSDAPGGLTSLNGSSISRFSLAVGDDDLPVVAFEAPSQKPNIGFPVPGIVTGQPQLYVKKYMGPAQGWQYLGSDPFGTGDTSAGGASEAVSFLVNSGQGYAQHSATTPSLVIDSAGRPNVAFAYTTSYPFGSAPEFVQGNSEIFVTRFDNGVWGPVGPAVPTGDSVMGRGGPGGVSNDPGTSGAVSLALSPTGVMWMTWHEASTTNSDSAIFVRRWNGTDTWEEVGGASASGGGISGLQRNFAPRIGIDANELPIVAWQNFFSAAVVFVARFDGTDWVEMGPDSASGDGVTGVDASPMSLGVSSGTPSTVNVAWLGSLAGVFNRQVRLRQFFNGPSYLLSVDIVPSGSGRIVSAPIGIDCPADSCSEFFPSGQVVNLTAIAGPDTLFDKWTGACIGSAACNVSVLGPRSLNASFVSAGTLTVAKTGLGTVTGSGIACGADCEQKYKSGTLVTLTATMPVGTIFDGWGGACAFRGKNTSCPLTVTGNTSVLADFSQKKYHLAVNVTAPLGGVYLGGGGRVVGVAGPSLDCQNSGVGTCSADVDHGTRVILQSIPEPANRFVKYAGTICSGRTNATCDFTMVANYSTNARFSGVTTIVMTKTGNAANQSRVTGPGIVCGADCVGTIDTATRANFTATPVVGSKVTTWGDACIGFSGGTCNFIAQGVTQTVTVDFKLNRHHLRVTGDGFGYTQSNVSGIDCGSVPGHPDCDEDYDYGTTVALTPTAGTDSMFVSWTGCTRLNGSTCFVDMVANRSVHKKFIPARTLDLSASGNGHGRLLVPGKPPILCTGCSASFLLPFSATVPTVVTATPDLGSNFRWVGGSPGVSTCIGKSTPCPTLMNANQSVVGSFSLNRHAFAVTNRLNGSVVGTFGAPDPFDVLCGSGENLCATTQNYGTPVSLQATANVGFRFVNWTGTSPCSVGTRATNSSCSFVLQANTTVTPNYRAATAIELNKAGNGQGTIAVTGALSPAAVSCGPTCPGTTFTALDGKLVTLTATPAVGSHLTSFAGACVSTSSPCAFTPVGNNQTITSTFTLRQFVITAANVPGGHVSTQNAAPDFISCGAHGSDCTATHDYNSEVFLLAEPEPEYVFVKWTGTACNGSTNPECKFKMPLGNVSIAPSYRLRTNITLMKDGNGKATIVSTPAGLNCLPNQGMCSADFFNGTPVTLRATPAVGSRFLGFSDACTSSTTVCTYTPSGQAQFVHAELVLIQLALNVTPRAEGEVFSVPGVINCGPTCSDLIDHGTSVQLIASPALGYRFKSWTGVTCVGGNANDTCTFTMTANTTAAANFQRRTEVIVQRDGEGTGTVTGTGIACGADCSENVLDGKSLTLTATPAVGSRFLAWSGPCSGFNTSVCTFTPAGEQEVVTVEFGRQPVPLTINVNGPGTVNGIAPPCPASSSCGYTKLYGDQLVLQAAANANARFISWTGCTSVSGANCTVLMTASKTVTATFQPEFTLTVTSSGNATGTVTGTGITCGADCSQTYLNGTVVTLTRTVPVGANFQWLGDCAFRGTNSTCVLTMSQNHSVGAQFQLQQFTVTVNKAGTGQGRVLGLGVPCDLAQTTCSGTIDYGTAVSLTADVTGAGSIFDGWGGSCSGTGSCNLSVTTNRTVTAAFNIAPAATVTVGPSGLRTFQASSVTIIAGQTVRWLWGSTNHNVVSGSNAVPDNQFCSPGDTSCATSPLTAPPGTVYNHTFTTPGTYPYFCRQHAGSGMTGTITVLPPE